MKKTVITTLIFTLIGITSSFAQERNKGVIEVVPFAGIHISNINGDQSDGLKSRFSATFGVHADYFLNDRFSVRSGINYLPMGIRDENSELNLNYISIPLQGSFHFGDTRRWNVTLGVNNGFLINADFSNVDVRDQTESYQMAIAYGIGYRLFINEEFSVLFELQNSIGVTDYLKNEEFNRTNKGSSIIVGGLWVF